jgi:predicted regulator of Ras-like GTPase activity (Roadblock/LC7/MglB family)
MVASTESTESTGTDTGNRRLSHEARSLQWLLTNFVEEAPGVCSVAVISSDGLLLLTSEETDTREEAVEVTGPAGSSADLATVVSGIASLTDGASRLMEGGTVRQTAVAMENGSVFVMSISDGSLLGVHATADCDMSVVAYHMALFVGRAGHVLTPELRSELRQAIESADSAESAGRLAGPSAVGGQ